MKFELTQAALKHGLVATVISSIFVLITLVFGVWWSPLLAYMGAMFYLGREVRDIEKSCGWDLSKWNSAELIMPILFNSALMGVVLVAK